MTCTQLLEATPWKKHLAADILFLMCGVSNLLQGTITKRLMLHSEEMLLRNSLSGNLVHYG